MSRAAAIVVALLLPGVTAARADPGPSATAGQAAFEHYLDRVMIAESGGRLTARNPRSTAVGPFQFIEATFLDIARRHFAAEVATLSPAQILALRTDAAFARRAAAAFTRDNADALATAGLAATFANLRLAHLLGPGGAIRILRAPPQTQVALWLGPAVIAANPFMAAMRAADLIARCAREAETDGSVAGQPGGRTGAKPAIAVACDLSLASCRRWLALAQRRAARVGRVR